MTMKNARTYFKGCFHSFFSRNGRNTHLSTSLKSENKSVHFFWEVEVKLKWSEIRNKKWNLRERILENSQDTGFSLGTACLTNNRLLLESKTASRLTMICGLRMMNLLFCDFFLGNLMKSVLRLDLLDGGDQLIDHQVQNLMSNYVITVLSAD